MKRRITNRWMGAVLTLPLLGLLTVQMTLSQDPPRPRGRGGEAGGDALPGVSAQRTEQLRQQVNQRVTERGEVFAASSHEVRSQVRGATTVLFVVPEGTRVKKGDLVLTLDSSVLENQYREQEVIVREAVSKIEAAKSAVEVAKARAKSAIPLAELKVKVAELGLRRYVGEGGEFQQREAAANRRVRIARLRVDAAEHAVQAAQDERVPAAVNAKQKELEAARLQVEEAEQAQRVFGERTRPHLEAALQLKVETAKMELAERQASVLAELRLAETELENQKRFGASVGQKLRELEEQIASCQVSAPQDGMVLYPPPQGRAAVAMEAGMSVRERQILVRIPDLNQLGVRVLVPESKLDRVKVGQPAEVRIDAFGDRAFSGRVRKIASVPVRANFLNAGVVKYEVEVAFDQAAPQLRLGMTAIAEIDVRSSD